MFSAKHMFDLPLGVVGGQIPSVGDNLFTYIRELSSPHPASTLRHSSIYS